MNCEIVKDLLPVYIDGLTSSESNMAIEEHIKTCVKCSEVLAEMKSELDAEAIEIEKEDIRAFRKLNKRILQAVLITLAGCIVIVGLYFYFFEIGWKVSSEDMNISYLYRDDSILIEFELTNGRELNAWTDHTEWPGIAITFTECFDSILDDIGNEFSYGIREEDEHGNMKRFSDGDVIIINFKDKVETIYLKEVAEELGLQ